MYPVEKLYFENNKLAYVGINCKKPENTLQIIAVGLVELMEYTDIKDINREEIFEEDIVFMGDGNVPTLVFWDTKEHAFKLKNLRRNEIHDINKHSLRFLKQIIGNVYERPESLNI